MDRDPSLDTLLDLDGTLTVLDPEAQYWVKFEVRRVPASPQKPHGLDYSLTLHGPDSGAPRDSRLVGFDNAHGVSAGSGPGRKRPTAWDHKHRFRRIEPYDYRDAGKLIEDFWDVVDDVMRERGVW